MPQMNHVQYACGYLSTPEQRSEASTKIHGAIGSLRERVHLPKTKKGIAPGEKEFIELALLAGMAGVAVTVIIVITIIVLSS